jgi:hypothetical protein
VIGILPKPAEAIRSQITINHITIHNGVSQYDDYPFKTGLLARKQLSNKLIEKPMGMSDVLSKEGVRIRLSESDINHHCLCILFMAASFKSTAVPSARSPAIQ